MSKVIAILDKPDNCYECPMISEHLHHCVLNNKVLPRKAVGRERPTWCPLKEIPEKKDTWEMDVMELESADLGELVGWNECIDYILGKEEHQYDD